ncbi:tRNA (guanosine(37)-N1)-methyltransferase TrmD [[Mycoplasma] falconis]|uniref:tRNA (guanine-N(1)-)-methyltransferase n=1 Tax=[Mycoplasma] falconis TaxID=92403 RepID=A0A501X9J4_9BACT|nr:tRNA (guanosine(37)-N1)-methyltransferase TrmD [[Mycoplasma] falconis]TPE57146.1 tRNA (guanosine(37)-N1)-methyltransferase TrmD [[Mycoplasma] falconis]
MKINILTLFPDYFESFKTQSIIAKGINLGHIEINVINFRDFSKEKHHKVDDTPYGGGDGMLLQIEPIDLALQSLAKPSHKILISPQGQTFNQKKAHELSKFEEITLICGHYEGFDERISYLVDEELSIGDYILTGGEIPAMIISEAVARLVPGVLKKGSHQQESFENEGWLDFPQYTRPADYKGWKVPEVLLSGDHAKIAKWREDNARLNTKIKRPDLYEKLTKGENNES